MDSWGNTANWRRALLHFHNLAGLTRAWKKSPFPAVQLSLSWFQVVPKCFDKTAITMQHNKSKQINIPCICRFLFVDQYNAEHLYLFSFFLCACMIAWEEYASSCFFLLWQRNGRRVEQTLISTCCRMEGRPFFVYRSYYFHWKEQLPSTTNTIASIQ